MEEKINCPNKEKNKARCTCQEDYCERHGICCECIAYHNENGGKPFCIK